MKPWEWLDLIFDVVGLATWQISENGEIRWSEHMFRLYGMKPGDGLDASSFESKVHPDDLEMWRDVLVLNLGRSDELDIIVRILIRDKWQNVRIAGQRFPTGEMVGITQNVTDLMAAAGKYELLFKTMKSALISKPEQNKKLLNLLNTFDHE